MVLSSKGFGRLVITVFIIYGSIHEKNWVMGFMNFSLKYNTGKKNIVMTIL